MLKQSISIIALLLLYQTAQAAPRHASNCKYDKSSGLRICRRGYEEYGQKFHTTLHGNQVVISSPDNPIDHKAAVHHDTKKHDLSDRPAQIHQYHYLRQGDVKDIIITSREADDAVQLKWDNGTIEILGESGEGTEGQNSNSNSENKLSEPIKKKIRVYAARTGYEEIVHVSQANKPTGRIAITVTPQNTPQKARGHKKGKNQKNDYKAGSQTTETQTSNTEELDPENGLNNYDCNDGTTSQSENRDGACSHHGGIKKEPDVSL